MLPLLNVQSVIELDRLALIKLEKNLLVVLVELVLVDTVVTAVISVKETPNKRISHRYVIESQNTNGQMIVHTCSSELKEN